MKYKNWETVKRSFSQQGICFLSQRSLRAQTALPKILSHSRLHV